MSERREWWGKVNDSDEFVTDGSGQGGIGDIIHVREVLPGDAARIPQIVCDLTAELQELKHEHDKLVEAARAVLKRWDENKQPPDFKAAAVEWMVLSDLLESE